MMARLVACAAVSLGATLPFLGGLFDHFVGDDFGVIQLLSGKPLLHFLSLFTTPWTETLYGDWADELRPFIVLSYQLDALLGAGSPIPYHATNIVFNALAALLVLTIALTVARLPLLAATFSAVLFSLLPVHTETVAWIAGGRGDSMLAIFCLSSLLAYVRWRRTGRRVLYALSLTLFFCALFQKQSAIVLPMLLVLYDLLLDRNSSAGPLRRLLACVPFVLLTSAFLLLRYILFGQAIRENVVNLAEKLSVVGSIQLAHLQVLLIGRPLILDKSVSPSLAFSGRALAFCAVAGIVALAYREWRRGPSADPPAPPRLVWYFGPIWWLVNTLPLLATDLAPRHLYLAAAGLPIVLGIGLNAVWRKGNWAWRCSAGAAGSLVLIASLLALEHRLTPWTTAAAISQRISADVQREAAAAPQGTLLLLGAPPKLGVAADARIDDYGPLFALWIWGWALPYALEPPFTASRLEQRVSVVSLPAIYCCSEEQWFMHTRRTIDEWAQRTDSSPVISLLWDSTTGTLWRQSESERPGLRSDVLKLLRRGTADEMRRSLAVILSGGRID